MSSLLLRLCVGLMLCAGLVVPVWAERSWRQWRLRRLPCAACIGRMR